MIKKIELNSDVGESYGNFQVGNDKEVMRLITTANVACGFHAGDPVVMRRTVALAKENNVVVGAHPGFPDLMGFGRRRIDISIEEAKEYTVYQTGALRAFLHGEGMKLHHIKPHGAFAALLGKSADMWKAMIEAANEFDEKPMVYMAAPLPIWMIDMAKENDIEVVGELYVELAYRPDGSLALEREMPDMSAEDAVRRVMNFVHEGKVEAIDGNPIDLDASSICIHGDGPHAVELLKAVRQSLTEAAVRVEPTQAITEKSH